MDIRRKKRLLVSLDAEIVHAGTTYKGFIGNLSEEGVYMRVASSNSSIYFDPGTEVELKFEVPSGETLNLPCRVTWSDRTIPGSVIQKLGMEVINATDKYKEFLSGRVEF